MKWPFNTKKMSVQQSSTLFDNTTVRNAEKNAHNYRPHDVASIEQLKRAMGVVHNCASKNADVCSMQPLRLMRRVEAAGNADRRHFPGKRATIKQLKTMRSGVAGFKVATFAEIGGDIEEVLDHPLLDLLARPNKHSSGAQHAWISFYMREICGKSYEMIGYGADKVPEVLLPMLAQYTQNIYGDEGIEGYLYGRSESTIATLELDDVLFYKHRISRFNPYDGEGPLAAVLAQADLLNKNLMFDMASVDNGNRPDSILSIQDALVDPKQLDELDKQINSKFGGYQNSHKTYVASGKIDWKPMSWPERELQSLAKVQGYEKIIREAFGQNDTLDNTQNSNFASALVGFSEMYMGATIRPRLEIDAAQKTDLLLPLFGLDPTIYCFVYDDPVVRDEAVIATRTQLDVSSGLLTINEARAERGYDPIDDEGANKIRVNGITLMSLDSSGGLGLFGGGGSFAPSLPTADKPTDAVELPKQKIEETALNGAQIAQLVDLAAKVSLGELSVEAARGIAVAAFPGIPSDKIEAIFGQLVEGSVRPKDQEAQGGEKKLKSNGLLKGIDEHELPEWTPCGCSTKGDDDIASDPLLRRLFSQHLASVTADFDRIVREMQDEVIDAERNGTEPNLEALRARAASSLRQSMSEIVSEAIKDTISLANTNVEGMFDVVNTNALEFLDRHAILVADDIASTTESMIRPAIQRGFEQGLSIDEIADELEGVPAYRAERIARTEMQAVAQGSRYETFKEIGIETLQWKTAPGASAAHSEIASRTYFEGGAPGVQKMGEPFVKAGEQIGKEKFTRDVYHPPARPNCRCSVRAMFPEGDE